jgi:L-amino acid N-acyltransferase YncA
MGKAVDIKCYYDMVIVRAEDGDSRSVWEWRNDPQTREMFVTSEPVVWEEHVAWYQKALRDSDCYLFLGVCGEFGKVGVCRFDVDRDRRLARVSINLNPVFRGRGVSSRLLEEAILKFREFEECDLVAEIKNKNMASLRCFEKNKFLLLSRDFEYSTLRRLRVLSGSVVVSQPRYLPALNYIQRLYFADSFVVFDTVQRQSRGWENRNQLLLPHPRWLTMPIASSSRELIKDSRLNSFQWVGQHKGAVLAYYKNAPAFDVDLLECYFRGLDTSVANADQFDFVNTTIRLLKNLGEMLRLEFNIIRASDVVPESSKRGPEKLVELCVALGARTYVSGPNGRGYGVGDVFRATGIDVVYHDYKCLQYPQVSSPGKFVPYMGFFDALFNMGADWVRAEIMRMPVLNEFCEDKGS